jgi:SAM-dependent methyltransferase
MPARNLSEPQRARLRAVRAAIWHFLSLFGFDNRDWSRIALYDACDQFLRAKFDAKTAKVLGVSTAGHFAEFGFENFRSADYPEFDICRDTLPERFDLIVADQVFEHVRYPYRAARHVLEMLAPGGWFLMATPFLYRIHREPIDCSRWSAEGIKYFLGECGFDEDKIITGAWGNRSYVRRHLWWPWGPRRGFFGSLKNQPDFPVVVWAFAQK